VSGVQVILRDDGRRRVTITRDRGQYDFLGVNPSINEGGEVSFAANLDGDGEAILRGDGGPLVTVATTEPGRFNFFGFDTSINDGARVAFKAELDESSDFDEGLFSGRGGPIRTHYLASTSPFDGSDSGPSMNDQGEIAFHEFLDEGDEGIFRTDRDGGFVTIADTKGPIGFVDQPSIDNRGQTAFVAFFDEGGEAILLGNGGPLTTVASTDGPFGSFGFGGPSLNDAGQVAFTASSDESFDQALYLWERGVIRTIITPGDALAGSSVTNVVSCREALDDGGAVAFVAQLADGRSVVVRAREDRSGAG